MFSWSYVIEYFPKIIDKFPITLQLVFIPFVVSFALGFGIALLRLKNIRAIDWLLKLYVSYVRCTPVITQNLIMCFSTLLICLVIGLFIALARIYRVPVLAPVLDVLLALTKAFPANLILLICVMAYTYTFNDIIALLHLDITIRDVNLIYIAIIALIIVALPGLSEVMRSGLLAIPKGQFEAGYAVGMTAFQTFRDIILPQLFRVTVPMLTNSTLSLMKTTALVNVMGVSDILKGATDAATDSYCFLEAYVAAALIFWCLGALIEKAGRTLEAYLNRSHKRTTA